MIFLGMQSCQSDVASYPLIKQVKLCSQLVEGLCQEETPIFSSATQTFYISCILEKVHDEAEVSFFWYFYEKNKKKKLLEKVVLRPRELSPQKSSKYVLVADLNRSGGRWPSGKYEVEVILSGTYPFTIIKTFEI
jgi:hypothetical protein